MVRNFAYRGGLLLQILKDGIFVLRSEEYLSEFFIHLAKKKNALPDTSHNNTRNKYEIYSMTIHRSGVYPTA